MNKKDLLHLLMQGLKALPIAGVLKYEMATMKQTTRTVCNRQSGRKSTPGVRPVGGMEA